MSEYQYYEFQAVDRRLTEADMRALRALSSRATITPTHFVNEYHWGDFKGDAAELVERYFDAFVYFANWGTRELMLRLPAGVLDPETARVYLHGELAASAHRGGHTILSFHSHFEDDDTWGEEDGGWMASILPLRAELAGGDHRALYLGWLLYVQEEEMDDDEPEPPVPPGLGTLSGAQEAFRDFLRIDPGLVAVAAERSAGMEPAAAPRTAGELRAAAEALGDDWIGGPAS